jgi:biopolymer transport protein ExbB
MFTEFNWNEAISTSPITFVIIGFSVVMLGVTIERFLYYRKRTQNPDLVLDRILGKLEIGDLNGASAICENCSHPLGNVALQLFRHRTRDREPQEEQMQIALSQDKMLLERNLGILGTLAAVAPLVGLLGTVWGIMRAFSDMAITGSAAPSVVASGVAEALVTTAAGLIVAVPSLMLYNYFTRRMNVALTVAENHGRSVRSAFMEVIEDRAHSDKDHDRRQSVQTASSVPESPRAESPVSFPVR